MRYTLLMREDTKTEFYKTKAIYDVLKRCPFTKEQKNDIYAAIATTKRDKPNMVLIERADRILSEVAGKHETRGKAEVDPLQTSKAIAQTNLSQYRTKRNPLATPVKSHASFRWGYGFLTAAIVYAMTGS